MPTQQVFSPSQISGALIQEVGTWIPTGTAIANIDAASASQSQYMRLGTTVIISGRITVDPTTNGVATRVRYTLPIETNFNDQANLAGVLSDGAGTVGLCRAITSPVTNEMEILFTATVTISRAYSFIAMYLLL